MAKWAFLAVILYIILVMVLFLPAACALADIIAGEDVSLSAATSYLDTSCGDGFCVFGDSDWNNMVGVSSNLGR